MFTLPAVALVAVAAPGLSRYRELAGMIPTSNEGASGAPGGLGLLLG